MSIGQFFRILLARRWLIIATVSACLLGALMVAVVVPPRYTASSRVILDMVKPDPVTGELIGNQFVRAYTQTQIELITDYKVAGEVVDELGWTNDPGLAAQFDNGTGPEGTRRAMAQLIIDSTDARLVDGSNILEITYTSRTPEAARIVADAIRAEYIDQTLEYKRDASTGAADWFQTQSEALRRQLVLAEEEKAAFEQEHGLIMQPDKVDLDSARLAALSQQMETPALPPPVPVPVTSAASAEVARVDAQISQLRRSLGPNHPTLRGLQEQRNALAAQAAQERAAISSANAAAARGAGAGAGSARRALEAQKSRVLANSENLMRLRQLQDQVDVRRDQYLKAATRAAELRLQGNITDAAITPLGSAVAPQDPTFPKMPLLIGGSIGLGLILGILAGLLTELLSRRVRSARDLEDAALGAPLLAMISSARLPAPKQKQLASHAPLLALPGSSSAPGQA